jgi:hypothetical protein
MVSRENRVILLGMGSAVLVAALAILSGYVSTLPAGGLLVSILVIPGLALLAPQLYLAYTAESEADTRRHRRVGLGLSGLLVLALVNTLPPTQELVGRVLGGGLLLALLVTEAIEGYRESLRGRSRPTND